MPSSSFHSSDPNTTEGYEKDEATNRQVGGSHYKNFKIQIVEFCQVNKLPYCEANIIKYACRWREKDGIQDLHKIRHYVDLLIQLEGLTEGP